MRRNSLRPGLDRLLGDVRCFGVIGAGARIGHRIGLAAGLILSSASFAQAPAPEPIPFALKQVGPGVYAAIDGPQHKADSNAGFIIGDDGVLVVDCFFNADAARALVDQIHRLTPKPIRYVVNTHYHLDHSGGDQVLRNAGAIIIAHRNVRGWIRTNNINLLGSQLTPALKAQIESLPLPDVVTDKDLAIWLGSRKVVVETVLGHTGGDLVIYVPDARVLFTGDLFWRKVPPNLIDGSVAEWAATDADFAHMPDAARTIFVPGHGELGNVRDVEEFRAYLLDLRHLVTAARSAGIREEALASNVTPKLKALHPDWNISDRAASFEIRYMDQELAGTKHRPVPVAEGLPLFSK